MFRGVANDDSLSKSRKKRPVPKTWASPADIAALETEASNALPVGQSTSLDLQGGYAALAGLKGEGAIYSVGEDKLERQMAVEEPVTDTLWADKKLVFATSRGAVKVYEGGKQVAALAEHAGAATGLSLHPSGDILASVGSDKSVVFYDLRSYKRVSRVYVDACKSLAMTQNTANVIALTTCAFHPDGQLFAAGSVSGEIKLFMTTSLEQAAAFSLGAPVQALSFSENGFWLAATAKGQTTATIFDLRKEGEAATAKVLETGGAVQALCWDYSGQFLATGGPSGVTVQQYLKSSKAWSEPFRNSTPAVALRWGEQGRKLVSLNGDGVVTVFGAKA